MNRIRMIAKRQARSMARVQLIHGVLRLAARTRILPLNFWKRVPFEGAFRVKLPNGSSFVCRAIDGDRTIGRTLYWRGLDGYEPETTHLFYTLARNARVVLDIGASSGLFTLIACAANRSSHVIAIEPLPPVYERLVEQVRMNGWEQRCTLVCAAVASTEGVTKFYVPSAVFPTSASLLIERYQPNRGQLIEVAVTTVDTLCTSHERVDLVKIDVEGAEDQVLTGMQRALNESKPDIIIECNPDGPYRAVEALLTSLGYRFFHLRREGAVACARITPDEHQVYRNYLCSAR